MAAPRPDAPRGRGGRRVPSVLRPLGLAAFALGCLLLAARPAPAEGMAMPGMPEVPAGAPRAGEGWQGFRDFELVAQAALTLLLAAALGAAIAFHPRTRRKATTIDELDQPKTFLTYSVVGALIGEIVSLFPIAGFVVFGIGGLLRFRTDVGPARDTGRVILVTIVGLTCGLKIYVMAVLATIFGWVLIWWLEASAIHRMLVKGLEGSLLAQSAEAYLDVLAENGLRVLSQKKNFVKGQVAFVFRAPGALDRDEMEQLFKDIPPKLQGAVDWEIN